jgi:hypothetical protein
VRAHARDTVQLIIDASAPLEVEGATCTVGACSIEFSAPPDEMSGSAFVWNQPVVEFVARVDG